MKYKDLYTRACDIGKLRKDEYTKQKYIDDVNELGRTLWTTIFQGVNGNKPKVVRKKTITISGDLNYVHTRVIKKTPILKIVYEECSIIKQKTDKEGLETCFTYEYDDDEIRFTDSVDGDYVIYYEAGTYTELTETLYDADEEPEWLKDDFHTLFWSYPAFLRTDLKKEEMGEFYLMHKAQFEKYYSRTETLECPYMTAGDTQNQL